MLRSSKLQLHYMDLCKKRKLCYVLIALKSYPQARLDQAGKLTVELEKLKYFMKHFTPSTNKILYHKQLVYIQLYNTIEWFLDDNRTEGHILGTDFNHVFHTLCDLLKDDPYRDLKQMMIDIANHYTGIYYTSNSLENRSADTHNCPSCTIDVTHYGTGRKHNLCDNDRASDPELPSMSFINLVSPDDNICAHMISHEEINSIVLLLKYIDDHSNITD